MTKGDIIKKITSQLGDPNAEVYAAGAWHHFLDSIYEAKDKLSPSEAMFFSSSYGGIVDTSIIGDVKLTLSHIRDFMELASVSINGFPAKEIDAKEYRQITTNSLLRPYGKEALFVIEDGGIRIITGLVNMSIAYEIKYFIDINNRYVNSPDSTDVAISNATIYRAITIAVDKLRKEVGLSL